MSLSSLSKFLSIPSLLAVLSAMEFGFCQLHFCVSIGMIVYFFSERWLVIKCANNLSFSDKIHLFMIHSTYVLLDLVC